MHYDNDSKMYDHAFFPSKWKFIFLSLGCALFVGMFVFIFIFHGPEWKTILGLSFFGACFLLSFFLAFWYSRQLTVGINRDGVFVRKYGLVPWEQIEKFEITIFGIGTHAQKCIMITLRDPDSFFAQLSTWHRWGRFATKKKVAIVHSTVAIRLDGLLQVLQSYHRDVIQNG